MAGPVHPAYNPYFQLIFSVGIVFFSHNKSANSVFQPAYQQAERGHRTRERNDKKIIEENYIYYLQHMRVLESEIQNFH
jgi:hypothetical protein